MAISPRPLPRATTRRVNVQGQTRQHSRFINLLGVDQIAVGVNEMDCDTASYKHSRYYTIENEMKSMFVKDFIEKGTP
eukprot:15692753-Heterocapsa_arctica.AAC.1